MWKLAYGDQWFAVDGASVQGDTATVDAVRAMYGDALPLTPTGPTYEAQGDADEVWLWAAARRAFDGEPRLVAGAAPKLPIPPVVEGAVY